MTKLVEWPVVDSVPRLSLVLYTGHEYAVVSGKSERLQGFSHIYKLKKK